jgi:hypothetical protein
MRMGTGRQNGIWVLALAIGFVAFVIWDQTRGGEAGDDARPGVTRARPAASAPAPDRDSPPESNSKADEDPGPPTSGVM